MKTKKMLYNFIILFVGANPMPVDEFFFNNSNGTPVDADSNGIHFWTVLDFFKMKRWMTLIANPKLVGFLSQLLHFGRKFREKFWETFSSSGFQRLSNPPSPKLPASISTNADSASFCKVFGELEKASSQAFSARNSSRIKEAIQSCISIDSLEMVSIAFSKRFVMSMKVSFFNLLSRFILWGFRMKRGLHQLIISCREKFSYGFSFSRKLQSSENMFFFQFGKVFYDLFIAHSRSKPSQYVSDRNSRPFDAWLPRPNIGVKQNIFCGFLRFCRLPFCRLSHNKEASVFRFLCQAVFNLLIGVKL